LNADLNQPDDSKRGLKEIDQASSSQLFKLFNIKDHCTYVNGFLSGDNLQCLNNIWKNYVPPNWSILLSTISINLLFNYYEYPNFYLYFIFNTCEFFGQRSWN